MNRKLTLSTSERTPSAAVAEQPSALETFSVNGGPATAVYAFSWRDALAALVELWPSRQSGPAPETAGRFHLLHLAGFLVTLPVFALRRVLPRREHQPRSESVFVETNRAVLTALGFAFMA